ncbi:MAG: hypothetical protein HY791_01300 [Deltaproteobacteria bacterium]|nr:hypothetical protein [Deltaproteobacteria bacterium]
MNVFKLSTVLAGAAMAFTLSSTAHADEELKNLKVIQVENEKALDKIMQGMSKGLGVKCVACHVKGKWDKDDVAAKDDGRKFFEATVGVADQAKRDAALAALLPVLKLQKAKNAAGIWAAVDKLKRKAADPAAPAPTPPPAAPAAPAPVPGK